MKSEKYYDRKKSRVVEIPVYKGDLVEALYTRSWGRILREMIIRHPFFSFAYGKYLDSGMSKSMIRPFIEEYGIDMEECCNSVEEFHSFNDFFFRKLRPGSRVIKEDDSLFVSPCDSRVLAFENIGRGLEFTVKNRTFSINGLTGSDLSRYCDGTLLVFRLTPLDYHRFHFPVSGVPERSVRTGKYYYTVNPVSFFHNLNVFLRNVREYCFFHTTCCGTLLCCEVGAVGVGGIHQTYIPGVFQNKGAEKGYFSFGASTVILLVEKNRIMLDGDIVEATRQGLETQVSFGEKIAAMPG